VAIALGIVGALVAVFVAVGISSAFIALVAVKDLFVVCISAGAIAGALLVEDKIGGVVGGAVGFAIALGVLQAFSSVTTQPK
jgi:hypothetical protein